MGVLERINSLGFPGWTGEDFRVKRGRFGDVEDAKGIVGGSRMGIRRFLGQDLGIFWRICECFEGFWDARCFVEASGEI